MSTGRSGNNLVVLLSAALLLLLSSSTTTTTVKASPTFTQRILAEPSLTGLYPVQYPCAIAQTQDALGYVAVSRIPSMNRTIVNIYTRASEGDSWTQVGDTILAMTIDPATTSTLIACSAAIGELQTTVVVSISTSNPAATVNVAKTYVYAYDVEAATSWRLTNDLSGPGNASKSRAVAISGDESTISLSVPATVFNASRILIYSLNSTNGTSYALTDSISPPISSASTFGSSWTEDVQLSFSGNKLAANSPGSPYIYLFERSGFGANFSFVDRVGINTTTTAFTSMGLSGDGNSVYATYDYTIIEVNNATTRYNGVYKWSYDTDVLAWNAYPLSVNFSTGTLNTTTNITTYTYAKYINSPVSSCFSGASFVAPVYNTTFGTTENITLSAFTVDDSTGEWTVESFPLPPTSDLLLGNTIAVQQVSLTTNSGIGYSRMMSGSGSSVLAPTKQVNGTDIQYSISAYSSVADCSEPSPDTTPTNQVGMIIIVCLFGVGLIAVGAIVGIIVF